MGKNTKKRLGTLGVLFLAVPVGLSLSACGAAVETDDPKGVVNVVTSTNVYADIVGTIGAGRVKATPLITSGVQDPHSYEVSAQDKLIVSRAELVVENGGGYDGFLHELALDADLGHDEIITAVEVIAPETDDRHGHDDFNEHVWYSLEDMEKLAEAIKEKLSELRPEYADEFTENNNKFNAEIEELRARVDEVRVRNGRKGAVVTEPLPLYLLQDMGFDDKTPQAFSQAVEAGQEVSVLVLEEVRRVLEDQDIAILAATSQSETMQVRTLVDAARQRSIPVMNFSETIPEGEGYLSWMSDTIDGIARAVR